MAAIGEGVRSESPSSGHPALPSPTPAAELLPLEAKRCDIKIPEKKYPTQLRITVGGRAPRGKIAERHPVIIISDDEEPKVETHQVIILPRRSTRLLGVKRKDYNEKTPEPKDYGGDSDWEDDWSPSSWGAAGRDDNDNFVWEEDRKEREEEEREEYQEDQVQDDDGGNPSYQEHGQGCCPLCRERIDELFIGLNACRRSIDGINRKIDDMEWQAEEDYKFLNRNSRRLFGMVGNMRRKQQGPNKCGCKSCRGN
jgi:hypothetical protein